MKVRWLTFTAVWAIGFIVQLAALWILTSHLHFHYLAATFVATELTIVLNFFCHEGWTWSDRPAGGQEAIRRFVRFHVANGAVSLAGGALVMPLLIELGHVHYLLANVLTVGVCSVANFVAADRIVFKPAFCLTVVVLLITGAAGPATIDVEAAELRPDTLDAFDRYARATESRMDGELHGKVPFLRIDRLPEAERREAYASVKRGEIVVGRLSTRERGREIDVPHGLIHHWIGTTFAPHATVDRVVALMQGYDRYQEIYTPTVRRSHTISRQGESFRVYLQLFMKKIIGVVLNTEYDVRYTRVSVSRVHVRSYSTRIAEVQNPGTADEKEAPVGEDSGFLWRFYNDCSLEQRVEGTYIQCESLSLSRGIPAGLGWIVGPFVTSIPRESLEFTLASMRRALSYSGK